MLLVRPHIVTAVRSNVLHARRHLHTSRFLINNEWVAPAAGSDAAHMPVINPATGAEIATIALGDEADIDKAVAAAQVAFEAEWGDVSVGHRIELLRSLGDLYQQRMPRMAELISEEMGCPIKLATAAQAAAGLGHIQTFTKVLSDFAFEAPLEPGSRRPQQQVLRHEPIGVCGLITPWNWPMNQVALKVAPALAAGNTVVLKPSEVAPLSSLYFAEMLVDAGFPPGAFNLVNGRGEMAGDALARHPAVGAVSFTGSTRAGVAVTRAAAATVKRVTLELGGKGPNLVFADVGGASELRAAVSRGVRACFVNSGQSCNAPTRMLVERSVYADALVYAAEAAGAVAVGLPALEGHHIGPVASAAQYDKVQQLIQSGIDEGATLLVGGPGRAEPSVTADSTTTTTAAAAAGRRRRRHRRWRGGVLLPADRLCGRRAPHAPLP